eukprot:gene3428-3893_t
MPLKLPHSYLMNYLHFIGDGSTASTPAMMKTLGQCALNLLNDSSFTPAPLIYPPERHAFLCLLTAFDLTGIPFTPNKQKLCSLIGVQENLNDEYTFKEEINLLYTDQHIIDASVEYPPIKGKDLFEGII